MSSASLARYQLVHRNESVYHDLTWLLTSRERIRPREEGLELLEGRPILMSKILAICITTSFRSISSKLLETSKQSWYMIFFKDDDYSG